MQLSENQQTIMALIDNRSMTVNQITAELNQAEAVKSSVFYGERWTEGQVRSTVTRLWRREILGRDVTNLMSRDRSEYTFFINNYAYGVWKEQFGDKPVLNKGTASS